MKREGRRPDRERLKLDQSLRMLFRLSKRLTVQLINGLFEEAHKLEDVRHVRYGNAEFTGNVYERIVGDLFLYLDTADGVFHYHIEFQTLNDRDMVIRMFRYGFEKAQELASGGSAGRKAGGRPGLAGNASSASPLLIFPRQVVIFLEENESIGDELALKLRLPDGTETEYRVPVFRYWMWSAQDLREKRLYALLPLQVFRSRKRLRHIAFGKRSDDEKRRMIA